MNWVSISSPKCHLSSFSKCVANARLITLLSFRGPPVQPAGGLGDRGRLEDVQVPDPATLDPRVPRPRHLRRSGDHALTQPEPDPLLAELVGETPK